jgi:hypothetical protein
VYLAPALAIIDSPEFFGLNDNVCIRFCLSDSRGYNMAHAEINTFVPLIAEL